MAISFVRILVTRTGDAIEQLVDIANAIVEATRVPAFQVAEMTRLLMPRVENQDSVASTEARFNLQIAQLRLTLQQEIAE